MDIQEAKRFARNKIQSDDITQHVRKSIKETKWERQDQREGFRESFKPLISQFEKPDDDTKNIFTQNQDMLRNQRALTEGLRNNQLAITEGLRGNQRAVTQGFDQLDNMIKFNQMASLQDLEQATNDEDIPSLEEKKEKSEY